MKVRRKKTKKSKEKLEREWYPVIRRQDVSKASKQESRVIGDMVLVTWTVVVTRVFISSPTMAFGPRTPLP